MIAPDEQTPARLALDQPDGSVAPDPVTGGMVAGSPDDSYEREPDADLWGAAGADDIHEGLGDSVDLTPDEAARVLFGSDADAIRSGAPVHDESSPVSRRPEGEGPVD